MPGQRESGEISAINDRDQLDRAFRPVAAMVAGIAIYRTTMPTREREDVARMGRADLLAYNTTRAGLATYLRAGSVVEPLLYRDGRILIAGARPSVAVRAMDIDGLAAGTACRSRPAFTAAKYCCRLVLSIRRPGSGKCHYGIALSSRSRSQPWASGCSRSRSSTPSGLRR